MCVSTYLKKKRYIHTYGRVSWSQITWKNPSNKERTRAKKEGERRRKVVVWGNKAGVCFDGRDRLRGWSGGIDPPLMRVELT